MLNDAQKIIDTLRYISSIPVPKEFVKPEEEFSVLAFDSQIVNAKKELEVAINNKPNYDIPNSYFK